MEFNSVLKFKKFLWSLAFVFVFFGGLFFAGTALAVDCAAPNQCLGICPSGSTPSTTQTCPAPAEGGDAATCCQPVACPTAQGYSCKASATCSDVSRFDVMRPTSCETTAGNVCCKEKVASSGAACESSTDSTKTGKCQATACTTANPEIKPVKTACPTGNFCCSTAPLQKADCAAASGTCKPACAETEQTITNITKKCDGTQVCCAPKAAAGGDQAGAQGGNAPSGGDDTYSKLFNMMVAMLTFSISLVIHLAAWLAGQVVVMLMEILVFISGYNSFIRNSYVSEGWKIMRDLVNMFFVLGMLFIAFATVLKIEKYSWNKMLGNLLIMAVLVNFSKTICGVIIDFFQVLLMTFAVAYKDISAGNIFSGLGMVDWFKVQTQAVAGNVSAGVQLGMIASAFLGLVLAVVSMIVILNFCVILITRIVGLWMLVTFSPLAFLSFTFKEVKGVGQIYDIWQKEFLQYCLIGPFVAFTLWISVATLPKIDVNQMVGANWYDTSKRAGIQVSFSEAGSMDRVLKYLMSITTMILGLGYAKKFSVVGAQSLTGISEKFKDRTVGAAGRFGRSVGDTAMAPFRGAAKGIQDTLMSNPTLRRWATTEGRKQQALEMEGRVQAKFGPNVLAREQARKGVTDSDIKRLESQNAFSGGVDTWNTKLNSALEKGDFRDARALMAGGADRGWTDNGHVDAFKQKFGKNYTAPEYVSFTEDLEKRVEKTTGGPARFNEAMITGSGEVTSKRNTPLDEYKEKMKKMIPEDFGKAYGNPYFLDSHKREQFNPQTGKMEQVEGNKHRDEKLLATIGLEDDAGPWGKRARASIKKNLEELKADPERMKNLNLTPDQIAGLNKVYEACDAQYDGIKRREENGITSTGNENFFGQTSKGTATTGSGAAAQAPSARVENIRSGGRPRPAKPKPEFQGDDKEKAMVTAASQSDKTMGRHLMDDSGKFKNREAVKTALKLNYKMDDALAERAMKFQEESVAQEDADKTVSDKINIEIGLQSHDGAISLPPGQLEQNFSDDAGGYNLNKYDNVNKADVLNNKQISGMAKEAIAKMAEFKELANNKGIEYDARGLGDRRKSLENSIKQINDNEKANKALSPDEKVKIMKEISESIAYLNSGQAVVEK